LIYSNEIQNCNLHFSTKCDVANTVAYSRYIKVYRSGCVCSVFGFADLQIVAPPRKNISGSDRYLSLGQNGTIFTSLALITQNTHELGLVGVSKLSVVVLPLCGTNIRLCHGMVRTAYS
jgi:hypothetical protein